MQSSDRRKFLNNIGKAIILISLLPLQGLCTTHGLNQEKGLKLEFIKNIRFFYESFVGISISNNFYSKWSEENIIYVYLYASLPNKIKPIEGFTKYMYFGNSINAGNNKKQELEKLGYHTFLYKTAGNSLTQLNNKLLSYSLEEISFIAFHELTHKYFLNCKISYEIKEAACDIIGNYLSLEFSKKDNELKGCKVKKQIRRIEKINHTINLYSRSIENNQKIDHNQIYEKCEKDIFKTIGRKDQFLIDRYVHCVNNAFLLRYKSYSKNYFLLKELYFKLGTAKKFLIFISNLPIDVEKSKLAIYREIK